MAEPSDPSRYSETQLREIIARAAAPDQPLYSSREIRDIGAELGIEASMIDAAIVKVNESVRQSESRALGFVRYASYGAALGFIGATSLLTPGVESFGIIACGAMIGLSNALTRVVDVPRSRAPATFLRRNFVAWGSFLIGGTTFARLANPTWLGNESTAAGLAVAALWILSSIVGAVVAWRSRPPEDPTAPAEFTPPWRMRLASRIKKWVDAVLLPFEQAGLHETIQVAQMSAGPS